MIELPASNLLTTYAQSLEHFLGLDDMEISKIDSHADNDQLPDAAKTQGHKLCYTSPVLINYGSVNTLTQGKSGSGSDGGSVGSRRKTGAP